MKIVAQKYKDGSLSLLEVPVPATKRGGVLVRSTYSAISLGTELMKVAESKLSLVGKAKARPDQLRKVLQSVAQQGPFATYAKVMNQLDSFTPLGYSLSGVIEEVGADVSSFVAGQRVACGGNQFALHAEMNWVPVNLCVPIPDDVTDEMAAFTTVGAISMQGFRQSELKLGETALVIGLGLLGQILVRILGAAGVHVIGVDIDKGRCDLARLGGARACGVPGDVSFDLMVDEMYRFTSGSGVDCTFITAGGSDNGPVEMAAKLARDRGRIVEVGKCSTNLPWNEYMIKELEFRYSRSYGAGRYDPIYEEQGIDYPIGYVRWTEKRNMVSFLELLSSRRVDISPLLTDIHPFEKAVNVYEDLNTGKQRGIGFLFKYAQTPSRARVIDKSVGIRRPLGNEKVRIGVIGCGNYASSMLLPHLARDPRVELVEVATTTPLSATNAGDKFGFTRVSTDHNNILADPSIDSVMILTPHNSHAALVAEALKSGKAVYVEKPLAITAEELHKVIAAAEVSGNNRLFVGFNRRFSPILNKLRVQFGDNEAEQFLQYRINAGSIDSKSWYANKQLQGSRFIGEGGHFIDTAAWWFGANVVSASAAKVGNVQDCIVVTLNFDNGSVAVISYLTNGDPRYPKEQIEVFSHGSTVKCENFRSGEIWRNGKSQRTRALALDKGQKNELDIFITALRNGEEFPISFRSLIETTAATIAAEQSCAHQGRVVNIKDVLEPSSNSASRE